MKSTSGIILVLVFGIFLAYKINNLFKLPPLPTLEETWWGSSDHKRQDTSIRPFKINISEEILSDLKYRLDHTRPFTPPLEGIQQQYGFNSNLLKELLDFWRTDYNWKVRENLLNEYPQFLTNIQGLDIHYIHVKPKNPNNLKVIPLLVLHGFPSSFTEFHEFVPFLTSPQPGKNFVFEVIVPSLPGYGFSQKAVRPGLGAAHMALIFKNLMKRLNFDRFYGQGGDWGAVILHHIAVLYPDILLGVHFNMCMVQTPLSYLKILLGHFYPKFIVREDHINRIYPLSEVMHERMIRETGFFHLQATKPDTIGVVLDDSPTGLAGYILEKFSTGTNKTFLDYENGGLKETFGYDVLLDNVMVYWVTQSMTSAVRLYAETYNKEQMTLGILNNPILVPSACVRFENDMYAADGVLGEIYKNLVHLSDYKGGHFPALQLPELLANDVFEGIRKMEEK